MRDFLQDRRASGSPHVGTGKGWDGYPGVAPWGGLSGPTAVCCNRGCFQVSWERPGTSGRGGSLLKALGPTGWARGEDERAALLPRLRGRQEDRRTQRDGRTGEALRPAMGAVGGKLIGTCGCKRGGNPPPTPPRALRQLHACGVGRRMGSSAQGVCGAVGGGEERGEKGIIMAAGTGRRSALSHPPMSQRRDDIPTSWCGMMSPQSHHGMRSLCPTLG